MHANNRDDKGGNDFQVSLRTDHVPPLFLRDRYVDGVLGTNLHAVWDYDVLASAGLPERAVLTAMGPGFTASCASLTRAA